MSLRETVMTGHGARLDAAFEFVRRQAHTLGGQNRRTVGRQVVDACGCDGVDFGTDARERDHKQIEDEARAKKNREVFRYSRLEVEGGSGSGYSSFESGDLDDLSDVLHAIARWIGR